jgi:hypothetical protein
MATNRGRNRGKYKQEDPKLVAKRVEVEEALRIQRANRKCCPPSDAGDDKDMGENESTVSIPASAHAHIPGFVFDCLLNRYFPIKSPISRNAPVISGKVRGNDPTRLCIVDYLNLRAAGLAPSSLLNSVITQSLQLCVREIPFPIDCQTDVSKHSKFGTVLSSFDMYYFSTLTRNIGPFRLGAAMIHRPIIITKTVWGPSLDRPILASIARGMNKDSVLLVSLTPDDYSPQHLREITGICRSTEPEAIHSISWSPSSGSAVHWGGSEGIRSCDCESTRKTQIASFASSINVVLSVDEHLIGYGLRNGKIGLIDIRKEQRHSSPDIIIGALKRCVDHMHRLSDEVSFICQDITNYIKLFDIRYSMREASIISDNSEASVKHRRFWVSPRSEQIVVPADDSSGTIAIRDPHDRSSAVFISLPRIKSEHQISSAWKIGANLQYGPTEYEADCADQWGGFVGITFRSGQEDATGVADRDMGNKLVDLILRRSMS